MNNSSKIALAFIIMGGIVIASIAGLIFINSLQKSSDRDDDNGALPTSKPRVNIYVNSTIYTSVYSNVSQYKQDLTAQGYSAVIKSWSDPNVTNLKNDLKSDYQSKGLEGAVLVGQIPYALAIGRDPYNVLWEYPCDLYLMDLDGTWFDNNGNQKYDLDWLFPMMFEHSNGTGDDTPEIWVARIGNYTKTPGYDYATEINNYFARNHELRTNPISVMNRPHKALLYIDDDWAALKDEYISNFTAYTGNQLDCYYVISKTNSTNFMNNITNFMAPNYVDYELVHLMVHSYPNRHLFGPSAAPGSDGTIWWNNVRDNATRPLFYNLFACYACNFTTWNNLGTYYLFTSAYTITVVGSGRDGCMSMYQPFYDSLNAGKIFGEAFKDWFHNPELRKVFVAPPSHWHEVYGMVILGDPLATIYMT